MRSVQRTIMYVITGLGYGGAESQLVEVVSRVTEIGWNVKVVSMTEPEAYVDELTTYGAEVVSLHMKKGFPDPRGLTRLWRLVRLWAPDLIHSHMFHANLLCRALRIILPKTRLICTAHSISEGGRVVTLAYRYTDFLAHLTTNVSQAAVDKYVVCKAVPKDKIRCVNNGVDIGKFKPYGEARMKVRYELGIPEDCFVWLSVGRFTTAKDHRTLIEAFSQLRCPNTRLLLAGSGELEQDTRSLVDQVGLGTKVHFLGIRRDIPDLMNSADGYVMSSLWEGLPMVLLEAAATGLYIVTTDVGGNREVVENVKAGTVVQPNNPEQLCTAMESAMQLGQERLISLRPSIAIKTECLYDMDRIVQIWDGVYSDVLGTG